MKTLKKVIAIPKSPYWYFFITLFAISILLSIAIIFPFLNPILTSLIIAYVFYPLCAWLNKKIKRKNISALIVSVLLVLLLVVPISFVLYQLSKEANVGYVIIKQKVLRPSRFDEPCEGIVCSVFNSVTQAGPEVKFYIEDSLKKFSSYVANGTLSFIFSLPKRILNVLLIFFFTFFLLRDGKDLVSTIEQHAPLKKLHKKIILQQVHEVVHAIVYGFFVIAIAEGTIGAVTFSLFGVASPIIWGLIIAFLAFIPFIGGAIIWIPAVIIQFTNGAVGNAIGITMGGLIISYIDTFIKPRIIGEKAKIHPAVILVGLLGGLKIMGFIGIIVGPIILSLFMVFIKLFFKEK